MPGMVATEYHFVEGGAVALGKGGQGAEGGQRVAGGGVGRRAGVVGQAQAVGDVPDGDPPIALAGAAEEVALGLVRLARDQPQTAARRMDVVGDLLGQRHGGIDKPVVVRAAQRSGRRVAFAGDGYPDLSAARVVSPDLRFATASLALALERDGLPFRRFERWAEVARVLLGR